MSALGALLAGIKRIANAGILLSVADPPSIVLNLLSGLQAVNNPVTGFVDLSVVGGVGGGIIYRPGVPSAGPAVATWPEVQAAIKAADGAITVFCDNSVSPCVVPGSTGVTSCDGAVTIAALYPQVNVVDNSLWQTTLTIQDGATLDRLRTIGRGLGLYCDSKTTPALTFGTSASVQDVLFFDAGTLLLTGTASRSAVEVLNGQSLIWVLYNNSLIGSQSGGQTPVKIDAGGTLTVDGYNGSILDTDPFTGGAGANLTVNLDASCAYPAVSAAPFPSFSGTLTVGFLDEYALALPAAGTTSQRPIAPNVHGGDLFYDETVQAIIYYGSDAAWHLVGGNDPNFGPGTDGSAVLDGINTFSWANLVGSVYTMTRGISLVNLTVNAGITLKTAGMGIYGTGTLTGGGSIDDSGAAGSAGTGGAGTAFGAYGGSSAGGNTGSAGVSYSSSAAVGFGGLGGTGGAGTSGPGSAGGSLNNVGLPLQSVCFTVLQYGSFNTPVSVSSGPTPITMCGGSGGGGGSVDTVGGGGGAGGGGGGYVVINFASIGNITIYAQGGAGQSVAAGGGGAGGGGGVVILTYRTVTGTLVVSVAGGAGGTGLVHAGANGAMGTYLQFQG